VFRLEDEDVDADCGAKITKIGHSDTLAITAVEEEVNACIGGLSDLELDEFTFAAAIEMAQNGNPYIGKFEGQPM
jgi:hypothetical protein